MSYNYKPITHLIINLSMLKKYVIKNLFELSGALFFITTKHILT